jgi:hypothetical protein
MAFARNFEFKGTPSAVNGSAVEGSGCHAYLLQLEVSSSSVSSKPVGIGTLG